MRTSPSYTASFRLEVDSDSVEVSSIVETVVKVGALVKGFDVAYADGAQMLVDVTCDLQSSEQRRKLRKTLNKMDGVHVQSVADQTFMDHVGGKLDVIPRQIIRSRDDLSRVYTPGVARICRSIYKDPAKANLLTTKGNTVAVVTDGTAVLGLGDIGPKAALPVMEGKAVLFKQFGGVDAWPVCLDTKDTEEIIQIVKAIAPGYGGINLEDIAAPKCFEIERRLREELDIPVFHDDQHGTAVVVLAALTNALEIVKKRIEDVRIVVSGVGAAGSAIIHLLLAAGAKDIVGFGRSGALHRDDVDASNPDRQQLAELTNPQGFRGTLQEGLKGADVFIGVSQGNILTGADIAQMNRDAIVFALANPTPEVDPLQAVKHARIVATGRSDFPNQINNVLVFPGLFRGLLDARVSQITTDLLRVCAKALAATITKEELSENYIIPGVFDRRIAKAVANAVTQSSKARQDPAALELQENLLGGAEGLERQSQRMSLPEQSTRLGGRF